VRTIEGSPPAGSSAGVTGLETEVPLRLTMWPLAGSSVGGAKAMSELAGGGLNFRGAVGLDCRASSSLLLARSLVLGKRVFQVLSIGSPARLAGTTSGPNPIPMAAAIPAVLICVRRTGLRTRGA